MRISEALPCLNYGTTERMKVVVFLNGGNIMLLAIQAQGKNLLKWIKDSNLKTNLKICAKLTLKDRTD